MSRKQKLNQSVLWLVFVYYDRKLVSQKRYKKLKSEVRKSKLLKTLLIPTFVTILTNYNCGDNSSYIVILQMQIQHWN